MTLSFLYIILIHLFAYIQVGTFKYRPILPEDTDDDDDDTDNGEDEVFEEPRKSKIVSYNF